jgi:hypothetical protein
MRPALALGRRAAGGLALLSFGVTAVSGVAPALSGWCVKVLIDAIASPGSLDTAHAVWLGLGSAGIAGAGLVIGYAGGLVATRMQNAITLHVQEQLYERINRFLGCTASRIPPSPTGCGWPRTPPRTRRPCLPS